MFFIIADWFKIRNKHTDQNHQEIRQSNNHYQQTHQRTNHYKEDFNVRFRPQRNDSEFNESTISSEDINPDPRNGNGNKSQWFPSNFKDSIIPQMPKPTIFKQAPQPKIKPSHNIASQDQMINLRKGSKGPKNIDYRVPQAPSKASYVDLDNQETYQRRVKIDAERQLAERQKRMKTRLEQRQRQQSLGLVRKQFKMVAEFVHEYLVHRLRYNEDHRRYFIPKKQILNTYFNWCHNNNYKVAIKKSTVIQTALTKQLKQAFPGIDCLTKYYQGLLFRKDQPSNQYMVEYNTLYE